MPAEGQQQMAQQQMDPRAMIQMLEAKVKEERGPGGSRAGEAGALSALAHANKDLGQLDRALSLFQTARGLFEEAFGPTHEAVGDMQGNIAMVLEYQEQFDQSL